MCNSQQKWKRNKMSHSKATVIISSRGMNMSNSECYWLRVLKHIQSLLEVFWLGLWSTAFYCSLFFWHVHDDQIQAKETQQNKRKQTHLLILKICIYRVVLLKKWYVRGFIWSLLVIFCVWQSEQSSKWLFQSPFQEQWTAVPSLSMALSLLGYIL